MALGGRLNPLAKAPKRRHPEGGYQYSDDLQTLQLHATRSPPRQSVSCRQPRILLILINAVERFCAKAGAPGKKREGDKLSINVTLN